VRLRAFFFLSAISFSFRSEEARPSSFIVVRYVVLAERLF
jgi:hypothetical protein